MHDLGRALGDLGISEIGPERRVQRLTTSVAIGEERTWARPAAGSTWFAVGTVVTDRPPHRTARAEFPHAAPTLGV